MTYTLNSTCRPTLPDFPDDAYVDVASVPASMYKRPQTSFVTLSDAVTVNFVEIQQDGTADDVSEAMMSAHEARDLAAALIQAADLLDARN